MLQISYKYKYYYYVENNDNTNVFIAAFATANVRLRLYEMLDVLGESVVYYKHIVYIENGKNPVKTECLRDWTDELGEGYTGCPKILGTTQWENSKL
jgi:hypothetical protein